MRLTPLRPPGVTCRKCGNVVPFDRGAQLPCGVLFRCHVCGATTTIPQSLLLHVAERQRRGTIGPG